MFADAGEVRIAAGAANDHFQVSVSDTGPGIPPEEREQICEKFRQVAARTRANGAWAWVSPLRERLSRCTAGAFGSIRHWVRA